jgi:uncharacterized membrane protein YebE (DUF533 family)
MTEVPSENLALNAEALKLLFQVAWANDHLHPKEREFLVKLAAAWRVPMVLETLLEHADQKKPLPQPNVALVRTRSDKVLRAAEALIAADGVVDEDEGEMLAQLKVLLGV